MNRVGCTHIGRPHKPFLVERSCRDAEQCKYRATKRQRCDLASDAKFPRHHQQQAAQAQHQPEPLARRHSALRVSWVGRRTGGRDPQRCQHRLQADNQRRQSGAHTAFDSHPHAAQVTCMHEDASQPQMGPLPCTARPHGTRHGDPDQKANNRKQVANDQKSQRRRVRQTEFGDDETRAPDQHKNRRHGPNQGAVRARRSHSLCGWSINPQTLISHAREFQGWLYASSKSSTTPSGWQKSRSASCPRHVY